MSANHAIPFSIDAAETAPVLKPQQAAPEDYYQNNFIEIFHFVVDHYDQIMPKALSISLASFLGASSDAQRLFCRLLTRKGPHFFEQKLVYAEVSDKAKALPELAFSGLIGRNTSIRADWLLNHLTKADLLSLFPQVNILPGSPKVELVDKILGQYSDQRIRVKISRVHHWCSITSPKHWHLVQLLYFGNTSLDWSAHVRRDLGQVRYESVELIRSRFTSVENLADYLHERLLIDRMSRLNEHPKMLPGLLAAVAEKPRDPLALRLRRRTLLRLGKWCEQNEKWPEALVSYQRAEIPPARERRVRIYHRQGDFVASQSLLREITTEPLSSTELIFSQRFGHRGKGFQPPTTTWQIEQVPVSVEQYVLEALLVKGGWGIHCENALIKMLTGLLYWDAIFAPIPGAFTNPFQAAPHDLMEHEFASSRLSLLQDIEENTAQDLALTQHLSSIATSKRGIANPLVHWGLLEAVPVQDWLEAIPAETLRTLCRFLIRNLRDYRKGFPDLFICQPDGGMEFVEVKGPSDQLQPQQRAWFQVFDEMGIRARIIKLKL